MKQETVSGLGESCSPISDGKTLNIMTRALKDERFMAATVNSVSRLAFALAADLPL